jgi:hypothetical protein
MIADKNLQLASSLDATDCATTGMQSTPNCINMTQLRDFAAGCPLYARICIRSDFTIDSGAAGVTSFAVRISNTEWTAGNFFDNGVFEYLLPKIGASETFATQSLTAGKIIHVAINPQAFSTNLAGLIAHDARGTQYIYATAVHYNATTIASPALQTPTGGAWDLDFVLSIDQGVYTAGSNKQFEGPFYPTNITRV